MYVISNKNQCLYKNHLINLSKNMFENDKDKQGKFNINSFSS